MRTPTWRTHCATILVKLKHGQPELWRAMRLNQLDAMQVTGDATHGVAPRVSRSARSRLNQAVRGEGSPGQ